MDGEHGERDPRPERDGEAREEDEMAEVHRIAHPAVRPALDDVIGRNREARTATADARAVVADQPVLQVAPREQRQAPRVNRRRALLQQRLGREEDERPDDECAVGRALQPALHAHDALCASAFGIQRMKRLATRMVPARNQNTPSNPPRSAIMPAPTAATPAPSDSAPPRMPILVPPTPPRAAPSTH